MRQQSQADGSDSRKVYQGSQQQILGASLQQTGDILDGPILHEGGYTTEPALLLCPSDPNADPYDYGPAYKDLYDYPISYGYPDYFGDLTAVANQPDNRRLQPKRHNQVRDPSAVLVMADLDPHKGAGNQTTCLGVEPIFDYPHDDEVNILMYDGHVESSDPQGEAVKIQWSRLVH